METPLYDLCPNNAQELRALKSKPKSKEAAAEPKEAKASAKPKSK